MNRLMLAIAAVLLSGQAFGATVNIYGHIDIGGLPQPPVLVFPEPVVIQRGPTYVERAPVYLHVPPGHRKNWSKHCGAYGACGQRVYFVQDEWYDEVYVPERKKHGHGSDKHDDRYEDRGPGKNHDKGNKGHKGKKDH